MNKGKKNIIFGWIWLLLGLIIGAYLQRKIGSSPEWMSSTKKMYLRVFHSHGTLLAVVNILYGYGIDKAALKDNIKVIGGALAIIGTVIFSGAFLGAAFFDGIIKLASLGSGLIIAAIAVLITGLIRSPVIKNE